MPESAIARLRQICLTVSRIENDYRQFPKTKLLELSNLLNVSIEEIENHYLYSDIQNRYSDISNYKNKILQILNSEPKTIESILDSGENNIVEFKSSIRYCLKTLKAEKHIEFSSVKNIAAFLNSNGGKLIIGVDDNGKTLGLENTDFKTFNEPNKIDGLYKYLDNTIGKYFGNDYLNYIKVEIEESEKSILVIEVLSNKQKPTIIKNPSKDNKEEFYIRRNASAIALSMEEFYSYSMEKWNTQGNM